MCHLLLRKDECAFLTHHDLECTLSIRCAGSSQNCWGNQHIYCAQIVSVVPTSMWIYGLLRALHFVNFSYCEPKNQLKNDICLDGCLSDHCSLSWIIFNFISKVILFLESFDKSWSNSDKQHCLQYAGQITKYGVGNECAVCPRTMWQDVFLRQMTTLQPVCCQVVDQSPIGLLKMLIFTITFACVTSMCVKILNFQ